MGSKQEDNKKKGSEVVKQRYIVDEDGDGEMEKEDKRSRRLKKKHN